MPVLKSVVRYLEATAAEERAAAAAAGQLGVPAGVLKVDPGAFHLEYNTDNIGNYLEAAAMLRCPRLLRDTVLAPAAKELSSRRVLALLERVVQLTGSGDLAEGPAPDLNGSEYGALPEGGREGAAADADEDRVHSPRPAGPDAGEEHETREQVLQAFCQVIQRLCARLDPMEFKLTSTLATGSPWASLEVLRAYRVKVEKLGRMNYALQSVTSTMKSLFVYEEEEKSAQQHKQDWTEHHFSLHVFRKHIIESTLFSKDPGLCAIAERAMEEQASAIHWSDDEKDSPTKKSHTAERDAEHDIPEAICDGATNSALAGLAGFVMFCDPLQTPPVLAAVMIRSLLLVAQTGRARTLFEAVFVRSRKAQAMVTTGAIPVDFLGSVKSHRAASLVLRRLLARYESLNRAELCHLLDHVLLEDFREEKHFRDLVLSHTLIQDLVVYCRVSTRSVAELEGASGELIPSTSGSVEILRLRRVGERLFAAAFAIHNGFLPLAEEPEARGEHWPAGPLGVAECPWDSGDLDLPLLQHVPGDEEALHLSRRVLLRGLFRRQRAGVESDVPTTVCLWALGRWPNCRDAALISEAFAFVRNCWRALRTSKAAAGWADVVEHSASKWVVAEESLFKMFSDLEFWRLPPKELLTPWVPPQLLACHIASKCKLIDEQQQSLLENNRSNLEAINRLRHTVGQLIAKLEVVDARSVQSIQKQSEVVDTLRSLR